MHDPRRLTALGVGFAILLLVAGAVAAGYRPPTSNLPVEAQSSPEAKQGPSVERIQQIVDRLKGAGIDTTSGEFSTLAEKHGVGGAVRILAFADASGKKPSEIAALFDGGKGWGQIRKELDLSIGPGIGWIMGGGHGQGKALGHSGNE